MDSSLKNLKPKLSLSELKAVALSEISGVHHLYNELTEALGVEIAILNPKKLCTELVLDYLEIHPVILHQAKAKLWVIGNLQGYYSAQASLDPPSLIPVRILDARYGSKLHRAVFNELVTSPLISHSRPFKPELIRQVWMDLNQRYTDSLPEDVKSTKLDKSTFANLLHIDRRQLK